MVLTLPWKFTISLRFLSSTLSSSWKLRLVPVLYPKEVRNRPIIPRKRSTENTKMGTFSKVCTSVTLLPLSYTSIYFNSALWCWVELGLQMLFSCAIQIPVTSAGVGRVGLEGTCKAGQETRFSLFLSAAVCFRSQFHFTLPGAASLHLLRGASTSRAVLFPQGSGSQLLGPLAVMTPTSPLCSPSSSDCGCFLSPPHCPTVFPVHPFCPSTSIILISHIKWAVTITYVVPTLLIQHTWEPQLHL